MDSDLVLLGRLIEAFRGSKALFAAVELGVFDRLADGPATVSELAAGCDEDALERLLDACVGLSLLEKHDGRYSNTRAARTYLLKSARLSLTGYIRFSNDVLFPLWRHLEDAVREGGNRWKQAFGLDGPQFSSVYRTEEAMRDFILGMHGFGLASSPAVVSAFDLSGFRRLVDLGGATGHLAMAAKARYPELKASVLDLPVVIAFAEALPGADTVEFLAGDFFTDSLPEADLYAVGRILHDWGEPEIRSLLAKIHSHLPSGGGLLIAERLLDEDKRGPVSAQLQSLNMLVITEGKERTLSEYKRLLEEAGFRDVQGKRTGSTLDALLCRKP